MALTGESMDDVADGPQNKPIQITLWAVAIPNWSLNTKFNDHSPYYASRTIRMADENRVL